MKKFIFCSIALIGLLFSTTCSFASDGNYTKPKTSVLSTLIGDNVIVATNHDNFAMPAISIEIALTENITLCIKENTCNFNTISDGALPERISCPNGYWSYVKPIKPNYESPFVDNRWIWQTQSWHNS